MKRLNTSAALLAALTFSLAAPALAQSAVPDLTGKWVTKAYSHHHEKRSFFTNAQPDGTWVIKEQQGRFFHGERSYVRKQIGNKKVTEGFSGVISRDGKRVYMVDHDEDMLFGDIVSADEIELVIMNDGDRDKHSRIGLIEIRKQK